MSHDIFISYSRKDLKQVIAIRDEIKETIGAESWIDIKFHQCHHSGHR